MSDQENFNQELALWESASKSSNPNLTIKYLEKYPSGVYSELAEARLDNLMVKAGEKKIQVKDSADNPFSKGTISGVMKYSLGATYSFARKDLFTGIQSGNFIEKVTKVSDNEVTFNNGWRVIDSMGNDLVSPNERFLTPAQFFPIQYSLGHKWITRYEWKKSDGVDSRVEMEFKVIDREKIETPAGTFNAFVIDGMGYVVGGSKFEIKYWLDPETCNRPIRFDRTSKNRRQGKIISATRDELILFQQTRA
jgi:hypothetical protein